ncbi:MAG: hypothetical protein DIU55_000665 [Bacillota bacterium]|nr:MAG: hypothetical protein DIU55_00160 [Bacillota bacterium]
MMPVGPILIVVLAVLAAAGFLKGPLRRIGLSERAALLILAVMLAGSAVELPLAPRLTLNLGAGLVPLVLSLYLLRGVRRWWEPVAAVGGAATGAASLALISLYFPPGLATELNLFYLDAQYLYAAVAGTLGCVIGYTRPASFAAAVWGSLAADVYHYLRHSAAGHADIVHRMGGGGFHGTALVAGVLALALSELLQLGLPERRTAAPPHLPTS